MMSTSQQPNIVQSMSGGGASGAGDPGAASLGVVSEMLPQQVHAASQNNLLHTINNNGSTNHYGAAVLNNEKYLNHDGQTAHNGGNAIVQEQALANNENNDQTNHDAYENDANEESDSSVEPIKLFVGQVPRTMEEPDLFPFFEKYGPMEDVAIIRDKHTGQHRGCAFVTFFSKESAEACENELHNKFTLEGAKRPLQIKPAGKREGGKLFRLNSLNYGTIDYVMLL